MLGGEVHGQWPDLAEEQLIGPGDVAVTSDYRAGLAEVCARCLKNTAVGEISLGDMAKLRGVVK